MRASEAGRVRLNRCFGDGVAGVWFSTFRDAGCRCALSVCSGGRAWLTVVRATLSGPPRLGRRIWLMPLLVLAFIALSILTLAMFFSVTVTVIPMVMGIYVRLF